ncbi:MAG TPA: hypothetical protein VKA15_22855 [Isosphaeraceae bacterium]|nr:hypothetical protein [Isosphaeraceae bacterium]
MSTSHVNQLASKWIGRLAHYRLHSNDEHRLALYDEALRYAGLHLENDLATSPYWSAMSLHHRARVVLFLVDRGVLARNFRNGRRVYEPLPHAESWVQSQSALKPYHRVILDLLSAFRHELFRRAHTPRY